MSEVAQLRVLLHHLHDGEKGFEKIGLQLRDNDLKNLFLEESRVRATFAAEIKRRVPSLDGEQNPQDGTWLGNAHRVWLDLLHKVVDRDDTSLLQATAHCENFMLRCYHVALEDQALPTSIRRVLQEQLRHVERNEQLLQSLRTDPASPPGGSRFRS